MSRLGQRRKTPVLLDLPAQRYPPTLHPQPHHTLAPRPTSGKTLPCRILAPCCPWLCFSISNKPSMGSYLFINAKKKATIY